eukprot:CAMPEP_0201598806 /NCGR_PEP_ID=MMETSP0492-20130828/500_1 /ASSEMBLY_ACC=CAM_ASM_000837 /TAXON_ID=420259 /ORGANISM="Thalassiosira gravida, Strain GMp14c1" /LENGTH=143 /DNA_ID=CAMNT_0048061285 /DNA_START=109 /DNA_END=540 /DNA_ORIENTATION=+
MTQQRLLCTLALCLAAVSIDVATAFTTAKHHAVAAAVVSPLPTMRTTTMILRSSAETSVTDGSTTAAGSSEDTDDVTCFVVNDEEIATEGEDPHVVCTAEPDDYAWFNGVDPKAMRETKGEENDAEECVEGESYKGEPEWECE